MCHRITAQLQPLLSAQPTCQIQTSQIFPVWAAVPVACGWTRLLPNLAASEPVMEAVKNGKGKGSQENVAPVCQIRSKTKLAGGIN